MSGARNSAERCVAVGLGETQLGRRPGINAIELQAEAVVMAMADAGLPMSAVDGLYSLGPYSRPQMMAAATLGEYLGISPTVQTVVDVGGVLSPLMMLSCAASAIAEGQCRTAVITFGEASATGRPVAGHGWTTTADTPEYEAPAGILGNVVPYALLAARHGALYGTRPEDLGAIAIATRNNASRNPNALRRTPFGLDEYMASRLIATPLRLFDCSNMVDGAGAILLTSGDRARDLAQPGVSLLGSAMRASHRDIGQFPDFDELGISKIAELALGRAGMKLSDVDVATIHDAFTISTLVYLEEIGFCGRGEGGDFARAGGLELGSRCPINPHGGLLSQGHVGGVLHVVEAIRQLRGDCGDRQVPGASVSLVAGGGGIMGINGVFVFGRV